MSTVVFKYRNRALTESDITDIRELIDIHYSKGRTRISQILCQSWNWFQPNGKPKELAARDLLLRLEENRYIELPPRMRINNNKKQKSFDQIPIFINQPLEGSVSDFTEPVIQPEEQIDGYLWDYLVCNYHYLGLPKQVGKYLRYIVTINDQVVACLNWASAAWKVRARDEFIGWGLETRSQNLYLIANNIRFLILPWIKIQNLASKILSLSLKRLATDWQSKYGHPVLLAETFVDHARFSGTCYQASNWQYVGQTRGSAKKGNSWSYHGQPKAVYLYPLHRHYRSLLNDETG